MPLIKSASNQARSDNIRELIHSGYNPKQASAIAYSNQRRSRAHGGANTIDSTLAQIVAALPRSGYTPLPNFRGTTSGTMPNVPMPAVGHSLPGAAPANRIPIPQEKPLTPDQWPLYGGYGHGGRPGYAGGGITVANSSVPPPTPGQFDAMPPATAIAPVATTPRPYSAAIGTVPLSQLAGSDTGPIASVNGQGIPSGSPQPPTTIPNNTFAPPVAPSSSSSSGAGQQLYGQSGGSFLPLNSSGTAFDTGVAYSGPQYLQNQGSNPDFFNSTGNGGAAVYYTPYTGVSVSKNASGGAIPQFAGGGFPSASEAAPWFMRREEFHPGGLFKGSAPGRADTLPVSVAADSHIVPADVVAGLGEGNNLAGAGVLQRMFSTGPGGMSLSHGHASLHVARPPVFHDAKGGRNPGRGAVPIAASSGEFNIRPDGVYQKGMEAAQNMKLDPAKLTPRKVMDLGHDVIDAWIVHQREKHIKTQQKLPKPRKD